MIDALTMSNTIYYISYKPVKQTGIAILVSLTMMPMELGWRVSLICPLDQRNAFIPLILQGLPQSGCRGQGRESREGL